MILRLPKDILRIIILEYLDGPSACSFVQSCSKLADILNIKQRYIVRHKHANAIELLKYARIQVHQQLELEIQRIKKEYQRRIDNSWVCETCNRLYINYSGRCCNLKCGKDRIVKCKCGVSDKESVLRPWVSDKHGRVPCFNCGYIINARIEAYSSELGLIGYSDKCIHCGIYCPQCIKNK